MENPCHGRHLTGEGPSSIVSLDFPRGILDFTQISPEFRWLNHVKSPLFLVKRCKKTPLVIAMSHRIPTKSPWLNHHYVEVS
jgi:hypothetical protein